MKQRLISAGIGLVVLAVVLLFFNTFVLNIVVALVAALAVIELLHASGCTKYVPMTVICVVMTLLIPFLSFDSVLKFFPIICYVFVMAMFLALLAKHAKVHVEKMAFAFMVTMCVPFSAYIIIYIRDKYFGTGAGIFYIIMALGAAWFSDTGAYFAGRAFGKHKMSPIISPHKTVEGAVGGVVVSTICLLLIGLLYQNTAYLFGDSVQINYLNILITAPICSVISILGDLSASLIKRQYGVKDYGNIMPGHGGVMDRFDSVLMVLPMILVFVYFLPFVKFI